MAIITHTHGVISPNQRKGQKLLKETVEQNTIYDTTNRGQVMLSSNHSKSEVILVFVRQYFQRRYRSILLGFL